MKLTSDVGLDAGYGSVTAPHMAASEAALTELARLTSAGSRRRTIGSGSRTRGMSKRASRALTGHRSLPSGLGIHEVFGVRAKHEEHEHRPDHAAGPTWPCRTIPFACSKPLSSI